MEYNISRVLVTLGSKYLYEVYSLLERYVVLVIIRRLQLINVYSL